MQIGTTVSRAEILRDGIDDEQSQFLARVRQRTRGNESLQFLHFQAVRKLQIHEPMADDLTLQTKRHGIANDATAANRPPAATLGYIGCMQTA